MDDNVEGGLLSSTALTGELKAAAINVQTRQFNTFFKYNVVQDLQLGQAKNPQYRMVTGMTDMRGSNVDGRPGLAHRGYVAEVTQRQMVAYGVPWMPAAVQAVVRCAAPCIPLDRWQFRTTATIRDS